MNCPADWGGGTLGLEHRAPMARWQPGRLRSNIGPSLGLLRYPGAHGTAEVGSGSVRRWGDVLRELLLRQRLRAL